VAHNHTFLSILQWSCLEVSSKEFPYLNTSSVHALRVLNLVGEFVIGKLQDLLAVAILRVCLRPGLQVTIYLLDAFHRRCDVYLGQVRDTKSSEHHREIECEPVLFQQRVNHPPQPLVATLLVVAQV
jgi:hypothetical protein